MSVSDRRAHLFRMEQPRRQTQRQLAMIDRWIIRRMTAINPQPRTQCARYRRSRGPEPAMFLEQYRANLAAITLERQHEIDALSRKLARQDAAIERRRARLPADLVRA
ncbi:hypothetical protein ASE05_30670 [Mesorhizobium sp. Root172]|jgi:hypothetical protein|nr:hypothetical protein ASE05_30670 [Mesorhizobium sp. Root172]